MTIAHTSYVMCDECGNPAGETVEGAKAARRIARGEGFVRTGGRDLCADCNPANTEKKGRSIRPISG